MNIINVPVNIPTERFYFNKELKVICCCPGDTDSGIKN